MPLPEGGISLAAGAAGRHAQAVYLGVDGSGLGTGSHWRPHTSQSGAVTPVMTAAPGPAPSVGRSRRTAARW